MAVKFGRPLKPATVTKDIMSSLSRSSGAGISDAPSAGSSGASSMSSPAPSVPGLPKGRNSIAAAGSSAARSVSDKTTGGIMSRKKKFGIGGFGKPKSLGSGSNTGMSAGKLF